MCLSAGTDPIRRHRPRGTSDRYVDIAKITRSVLFARRLVVYYNPHNLSSFHPGVMYSQASL